MVQRYNGILCAILLFRTNVKKEHFDENDWKLLDHSYGPSSFWTFMKHNGNRILRDTLELKILRTGIKLPANSFIKTLVKRKSMKVPRKLSFASNSKPVLERKLHQNIRHFAYFYKLLFLSNKTVSQIYPSVAWHIG